MSKVSVIIPVYNTEKFLRKCLDSVCNQTLQDIEIICINDCSTDGASEILREYARKDNRIKLIELLENCGAAKARNIGIDIAEGEYLGFVDSDDFIDLDFFKKLYNKVVETGANVVKAKIVRYFNENKVLELNWDDNDKIKRHKSSFIYGFTSAIYKLQIVKEKNIRFPEFLHNFEDPYFLIQYISFCNKIDLVDHTFYYYRNNKNSITNNIALVELKKSALAILKLINSLELDKEDYLIIYNHFYSSFVRECEYGFITKKDLIVYSEIIYIFIKNAKYDSDALYFYYKERQENYKKEKTKLLRQKIIKEKKQ